ncbi:unnamed protein product, partial [Urochloa humidicola]
LTASPPPQPPPLPLQQPPPPLWSHNHGYRPRRRRPRQDGHTALKSDDVCFKLLVKLYYFLAPRTKSNFNAMIPKRLFTSNTNRLLLSVRRLVKVWRGWWISTLSCHFG